MLYRSSDPGLPVRIPLRHVTWNVEICEIEQVVETCAGLQRKVSAGPPDSVAMAACDSGATGTGQKEPCCRPEYLASCFSHRVGANCVRRQYFLPLSCVRTWRGIPGSRTGQCCRGRVPENYRPQRHRVELLDGSVSASGRGSCQCFGGKNLEGRGRGCCPRKGISRLQGFSHALERRRRRHPYPHRRQV